MKKTKNSRWALVNFDTSKFPPLELSNNTHHISSSPPPGRPAGPSCSNKRAASSSPPEVTKKPAKAPNHDSQVHVSSEAVEKNNSTVTGTDTVENNVVATEVQNSSEVQIEPVNYSANNQQQTNHYEQRWVPEICIPLGSCSHRIRLHLDP